MSEKLAIIEESILQDTADAIRSKNNTTSKIEPKDFKSNILKISGGEDVSAETAEYTSLLTDLETTIEAMPNAGSGGGSGGSIETCTVTVNCFLEISGCSFTILENNKIGLYGYADLSGTYSTTTVTVENVVCGSPIFITNGYDMNGITVSGGVEFIMSSGLAGMFFKAPSTAGASATISIYDDD